MKILFHVHKWPPTHNAGAEWYAHETATWLREHGHHVRVLVLETAASEFEGIELTEGRTSEDLYNWADVVLTHLDVTRIACREARRWAKPLVHILHNDRQLAFHRVREAEAQLIVCNSRWLQRLVRLKRAPSIVVRPPIDRARYLCQGRGHKLTLLNLSPAKGGHVFWELARRLPRLEFLGVLGAYGEQVVPDDPPRNVTLLENGPDARSIYAQTRLLLVPSGYESWGRVAIEAAVSGIPAIGGATPGLVEAMGPAMVYCDTTDIDQWEWAITSLLGDSGAYDRASAMARHRAAHLALVQANDLRRLETHLQHVAGMPLPRRSVSAK